MDPKRVEAARRNQKTYVGKPCKVHGRSPRYVASGSCQACVKATAARWHAETREALARIRAERSAAPPQS